MSRMPFTQLQATNTGSLAVCSVFGTLAYLTLVRILRYRRINSTLDRYLSTHKLRDGTDGKNPSDYPMTPAEAQQITWVVLRWDAPLMVEKSLEFALFKTYGIETISDILLKTGQLSKEANATRRYADTVVLIRSWSEVPMTGPGSGLDRLPEGADPRGAIAIARTNWLHSKYKISNDDYLYTLSLFILEPARWIEKYEWRGLTPLERQAFFVFWSEIGRRLNIQNIPETLEGLEEWSEEYERAHMLPSPINQAVASHTVDLLLYHVPPAARAFGKQAVAALCSARLRASIMSPEPPAYVGKLISGLLNTRKLFIRYLCLPRRKPRLYVPTDTSGFTSGQACPMGVSVCPVSSKRDSKGEPVYRLHTFYTNNEPWYMAQPGLASRLTTRILSALGVLNPKANPGPQFKPQGFRTEEVGPISFEQSGRDAVRANAEAIYGDKITGPWAF